MSDELTEQEIEDEMGTGVNIEFLSRFCNIFNEYHPGFFGEGSSPYSLATYEGTMVHTGKLYLMIDDSDFFAWGYSGSEPVKDLELLEQTYKDCYAIDRFRGFTYAPYLYLCREYKGRPQGACYPHDPRFGELFSQAGKEKEVGPGNPYAPYIYRGLYKRESNDYFGQPFNHAYVRSHDDLTIVDWQLKPVGTLVPNEPELDHADRGLDLLTESVGYYFKGIPFNDRAEGKGIALDIGTVDFINDKLEDAYREKAARHKKYTPDSKEPVMIYRKEALEIVLTNVGQALAMKEERSDDNS